ncbi:BTAD domain-containing putative transcriptional regulator [Streptomyces sp. 6N223]|uniref:BTAD domain-containing putative transcriptional regulator n=1 Tax=Streptomyces sp. 6N223 TaxID=3457412 RepID=UPI003FD29450
MRVGILGPLELRDGAGRLVEVSGQRLRALLTRLAIDVSGFVTTDRLIHDLWAGSPPAAPGNALHTLVSRLRGAGGRELVEAVPGGYRLAVDPERVDAVAFERRVAAARAEPRPPERAAGLREALALWRGPALVEVADAAFAAATVTRLEELRLGATEDRVEAELALGEAAGLVPELEELSRAHPLRERLRGQLMRALYAAGRQAAALSAYEDIRRDLAERLGLDPSAELRALHLAVLRGDPGLDAPPPPRSVPPPQPHPEPEAGAPTNLPAPLTSFVGREEESERLGKLLGQARLVTLTGPGGAGKTRLAVEVTGRLVADCPDGVWLVPLAGVSAPGAVPQAVLAALGVPGAASPEGVGRTVPHPMDRLVETLARRRLILVLDNCEHLAEAVARLAGRLLAAAPGVRVLATSREPLGLIGETLCPVPPLPLPLPGPAVDAAEAMAYASVRLFADRAAAVRPGFALDDGAARLVTGICRALDGIPLAIELAAARLRSLTLRQVAERLGDRFRLLAGGSRAALPRHQTLRAVIDWSWELLDETERAVLRRLSVFAGGATPEGVEAVCGQTAADTARAADVVDVVAALIDKSLVMATGESEGGVRYRLLETVRAYAADRLAEAGERERIRAAHAAYVLALVERAEPELRRSEQLRYSRLLAAERDNCEAALRHALDAGDAATALRLVGGLAWFWIMSDLRAEAGGWAVAVRELAGPCPPPGLADQYAMCTFIAVLVGELAGEGEPDPRAVRAAVDTALGWIPRRPRHPALFLAPAAAALYAADLHAARRELRAIAGHADPWVRAISRVSLGHLALNQGRIEEASAELAEGHARFAEIGERWGRGLALGGLLELALIRGEPAEAVRLGEEAFALAGEGGTERGALALIPLGRARAEAGDAARGGEEIALGVRTAERIGEHGAAVGGHLALGELARRRGDLDAARAALERARELVEARLGRADFAQPSALTFSRLGCLAEQRRDLAGAARWHARAASALGCRADADASTGTDADAGAEALRHHQSLGVLVEGRAALAAALGEHARAAELLGAAHALRGFRDERSLEVRRATAAATGALGRPAFEAAYARGRRATPGRALVLAAAGDGQDQESW